MRIRDVMDKKVQTASWVTNAEQARETLLSQALHGLAVIKDGEIVGTVCLEDLGGAEDRTARRGKMLDQFVVPAAIVGNPRTSMRKVLNLMRRNRVDRLAIVNGSRVVGMFRTGWSEQKEEVPYKGTQTRREDRRVAIRKVVVPFENIESAGPP